MDYSSKTMKDKRWMHIDGMVWWDNVGANGKSPETPWKPLLKRLANKRMRRYNKALINNELVKIAT